MSTVFDALATQASAMEKVIGDLKQYHLWATAAVNDTWELPFASVKDDQLNALKSMGSKLSTLSTTLRDRVIKGTYGFGAWSAYAIELRSDIAYVVNDSSNWALAGVLSSTASQTVTDIGEHAKTALKWGSAGLGVAAMVAIGLAFLIYGPRR